MKIKVTATITRETEIFPEDYADDGIHGEEAIFAHEIQRMYDEVYESDIAFDLCDNGELSNIKIEKVAEDAAAQEQAA